MSDSLEGVHLEMLMTQCFYLTLSLQFADGVYLVLLMGLLEGYFVPLHSFFLTPDSFEQKVSGDAAREVPFTGPAPLST